MTNTRKEISLIPQWRYFLQLNRYSISSNFSLFLLVSSACDSTPPRLQPPHRVAAILHQLALPWFDATASAPPPPLSVYSLDAAAQGERYFGLENFGNTCYCNSVLQALYFCVPFREQLIEYYSNNKNPADAEENLLTCLADLFLQRIEVKPENKWRISFAMKSQDSSSSRNSGHSHRQVWRRRKLV